MSKEMTEQIERVKNWKQFLNENSVTNQEKSYFFDLLRKQVFKTNKKSNEIENEALRHAYRIIGVRCKANNWTRADVLGWLEKQQNTKLDNNSDFIKMMDYAYEQWKYYNNKGRVNGNLDVSKMSFDEYKKLYKELALYAKESEKKGKLDLHDPNYVPMTDDELELIKKDWKQFSKNRGYSDEDISKYEKWLKISGQYDGIVGVVNDPWRRGQMGKNGDVNEDYMEYLYHKLKNNNSNQQFKGLKY